MEAYCHIAIARGKRWRRFPDWRRTMTTPAVELWRASGAYNLAHSVVEGQPQHPHKKVDGVAGQIPLRPAPIAVFDEQPRVSNQFHVPAGQLDELEAVFLKQGHQGRQPSRSDLLASPARSWRRATGRTAIRAAVGHSLSSSGVGSAHG